MGRGRARFERDQRRKAKKTKRPMRWVLPASDRDYVDITVFGNTNKTYLTGTRQGDGTWVGVGPVSRSDSGSRD